MACADRLIVIGGTAAGLSAASKAKRVKPEMEVKVFERSGYVSYGSCGLPYFVGALIQKPEDLVAVSAETMKAVRGITVRTRHEVTEIDRKNKRVSVLNLETGKTDQYPYESIYSDKENPLFVHIHLSCAYGDGSVRGGGLAGGKAFRALRVFMIPLEGARPVQTPRPTPV